MLLRRLLAISMVLVAVGDVAPTLAGVTPCCPHRTGRVRLVRTGGLGISPGGTTGPAVVQSCEACSAWEVCAMELESAGASVQAMPLRNGVMSAYTADNPAAMRVVREALMRYQEHLIALTTTGDAVRLCPACRLMRGAAASGRLMREVIPIEGGGILLMTSPDPTVITMLRAEAGIAAPAQVKR